MFEKLKEIREYEGLTQEEVAKKLHVKRATYAGWECGKDIMPFSKLYEFAHLFHTSLDYLVGTSPNPDYLHQKAFLNAATVSKNLKDFRKKNHLTQKEMAEAINTSQSSIHKYENGKCLITTTYALEFSKHFHYSLDDLVDSKKNN